MDEFWERGLILRVVVGSRSQGLAREGSDTDTRGVCIPPARYVLGLSEFEQHESEGGDHVTYALAKFARLALQGNPNVLETLWVDPADVVHATDAGRELIAARERFLSKQVGGRFLGYAQGQQRRIDRHHRWLVDPPSGEPDPADFGGRAQGGRVRFADADGQKAFDAALKHWNHYRAWRGNRNPARAQLEEQHGYDTKHAMHLVRLLRMGIEVLRDGELRVRRPDAEELLAIRDGALTYDRLNAQVDELVAELREAEARTTLPTEPAREEVEALVVRLHARALDLGPLG